MIWMDVDIALASVPVNIMPLIDDTTFTTIEDALVYNQAGLSLFWNFTTTAGVTTVTAVTPTTAGVYDWTDFTTSGMYGIEIPASGGGTINNDTEGFGHFTGVATGVLPWTGPIIGFRAAALNNALVDGGDTLDVNVTAMAANVLTAAAINADAITAAKIADNALSNEHFAAGALTSAEITSSAGAAVASIGTDVITAASIAAGAVTEIQSGLATPTNITAATGVVLSGVEHTGAIIPSVTTVTGNVDGTVNLLTATQATIDVIDGTDGLVAISAQIDGIGAASGGALNFEASSDNLTVAIKTIDNVGTPTGVFGATQAEDGDVMSIAHDTNDIDHIFGFTIGGSRTATEVTFAGYLTNVNDNMFIQAYDFIGADWETIAQLPGQSGTTNTTITAQLLSKHTGLAADIGNVYIRFEANGAMTSPTLVIDKLVVSAVNIGQSIGYDQGAVHVDTLVGTAGTEPFVNGVADNPVDLWASAQTIAAEVGISHYHIANGSSVTLDQAADNTEISGDEYTIAFGGFSIDNTSVSHGLAMSGTFLGYPHLLHTAVGTGNITGPAAKLGYCAIRGACISNSNAGGKWVLHNCWGVDETTAAFDFGAAVGAQTVYITEFTGIINIRNMQTGDELYFSGKSAVIIAASCTGGTIHFQGAIELTNNGSGQTINYDNVATDAAAILVDTGTTLPARFDTVDTDTGNIEADTQNIQSRIPDALVGGFLKSDVYAISSDTAAADNLEASMETLLTGSVTGTPTTIEIADSSIATYPNDTFVGRVIIFRDGTANKEAAIITASNGTAKTFAFAALEAAPTAGDLYVIV